MQEALRRGALRGGDAQLPRRAGRVLAVEPVRREGRRPSARRRSTPGCWPASRASSSRRWPPRPGIPMRGRRAPRRGPVRRRRGVPDQHDAGDRADRPGGRPRDRRRPARAGHAAPARGVSREGPGASRAAAPVASRDGPLAGVRPRSAGTRTSGCGRRTGCRSARRSARTCSRLTNGSGKTACSRVYGCVHASLGATATVCGAFFSTLSFGSRLAVDDVLDLLRGSRSSRRRTDRARPSARSRSARP